MQGSSNESIANGFNNFFIESVKELANHFKSTKPPCDEFDNDHTNSFYIKEVTQDKVKKVIANMNNYMAKDNHNLNTAFIKKHQSCLLEPITYLVNLSIQTNRFPKSWKTAIITPVYKSGERDVAGNYRPIAILPLVSKVLEKIVAE